jgi:DNA invertase Pin-like site-specific DNA recombinase
MLDVIRVGAPFQVLIMRDSSRLSRRDGDEAFGELKAIARAGVDIWFYGDSSKFEYGDMGSNVIGLVRAEMNAEWRRQIAKWTRDSHERKALLGHVTGGSCFGYENQRINGHVERVVDEPAAAVVRRIYQLYAAGVGLSTIAHRLNADGALSPSAQQGRVHGWCASSVREILRRPLYRGELVWGRSKKRDKSGQIHFRKQDKSTWLRRPMPELRIVPEELALAVDARLASMQARTLRQGGTVDSSDVHQAKARPIC